MVRFKNRYLLFEILYQNEKQGKALSALQPVVLNLSTQELQRLIRDNIAENFGDYGVGSVGTHLQGRCCYTAWCRVG
jgi:RNase P/RNase MRP subunit POP5